MLEPDRPDDKGARSAAFEKLDDSGYLPDLPGLPGLSVRRPGARAGGVFVCLVCGSKWLQIIFTFQDMLQEGTNISDDIANNILTAVTCHASDHCCSQASLNQSLSRFIPCC